MDGRTALGVQGVREASLPGWYERSHIKHPSGVCQHEGGMVCVKVEGNLRALIPVDRPKKPVLALLKSVP